MSQIRKYENFHIFLWLLKDTSWLLQFKAFGIFMIFPTIGFAILITWKGHRSILYTLPNLAVLFWIIANSFWMVTEFLKIDEQYKLFSLIPFTLGITCIVAYYVSAVFKSKLKTAPKIY